MDYDCGILNKFFNSNYILRIYIESYMRFTISSVIVLYSIGVLIITFMEHKNKKMI